MTTLTRRTALTAIAVAPAAVALPVSAENGPSELADLIRRYFAEVDVFNATEHENDEESNAHAEGTYEATLERMVGVPVRTRDDALAAVEFLDRTDLVSFWGDTEWFLEALRGYLEGRVA